MNPLERSGCLYICSTPIGNLDDITLRAIHVLRSVDWIAAEDTRHTRKLLSHHRIDTSLTSLHEHNEKRKSEELVRRLVAGESGALVSDAGTPMLSDPGFHLVRESLAFDVRVVPIPGASAMLAALVGSGLSVYPFYFGGFLPRKPTERRRSLESLQDLLCTLLFYEVPHRLQATLKDVAALFPNRQVVVARELTKIHEQFVRGMSDEVLEYFTETAPRGECVLLIEGSSSEAESVRHRSDVGDGPIEATLRAAIAVGRNKKEAIKDVASFLNVDRKRVYRIATQLSIDPANADFGADSDDSDLERS